jgi:hypothetical protein
MRFGIVGSRSFLNYPYLCVCVSDAVTKLGNPPIDLVVSGGAKGADTLAIDYAKECGYVWKVFPANWERDGKSAGYKRNVEIVNNSDVVIAFWDGKSKGTAHTINLAKEQKKPCFIYTKW